MNLVQRLVRANRTLDGIQSGGIHFFFAGKRTNQAKPLLPRFSAVFALSRVRTWSVGHVLRKPGQAITCPGSQTQWAAPRVRRSASRPPQL
jgi:hypothetical protein